MLIQLPMHHTDGLIQGAVITFRGDGLSPRGPFSIQGLPELLDWIYRHRITHFYTVPTVLALTNRLAANDRRAFATPDFRFVISSAGYLEAELWRSFEEQFGVKVVNVYGLTETVSGSLYCGPDEQTRKVGTIGKPVDCECRVVDDQGRDVPHSGGHGRSSPLAPVTTIVKLSISSRPSSCDVQRAPTGRKRRSRLPAPRDR